MEAEQKQDAEIVGTQIITLDPVKYVAAVYAPFRDQFTAAKAAAEAVTALDVTTPAGMKVAIHHRAAFRVIRVEAEKARVFRKKPILDIGRLLDSRYKEFEAEIAPLEDRFDAAIKAEEQRRADEKAAAEKVEAERVARIQAAIRDIRGALIDVAGRNSGVIDDKIRELVAIEITAEHYAEFTTEGESARESVLAKLREMRTAALEQEREAVRLAAERVELERLRAEQAERERVETERRATEQRQADEAAAVERARIAAEEQAARDRIATQEREARERLEAEERRQQAERDRLAAEARALEERQRKERDAAEERQRQERLAAEAKERDERLARDSAEREAREAELTRTREEQRKTLESQDIRDALGTLRGRVNGLPEFAWFAKAYDASIKRPARAKAAA